MTSHDRPTIALGAWVAIGVAMGLATSWMSRREP